MLRHSKKYATEYLSFTHKERTGILVIIALIILFAILPFLFPFFMVSKPVADTAFEKEIAALKLKEQDSSREFTKQSNDDENTAFYYQASEKNYDSRKKKGELFYFDPNTLSADGWKRLGIRDKTAGTIQNYLSKGGKFYKAEDIGKIWGLHTEEVKRLLPYIRIEQTFTDKPERPDNAVYTKTNERSRPSIAGIDINAADTSALISLPGIGSKIANRIIAFRNKLGGFYKVDQVAETYALPDSTFQKIKEKLILSGTSVKKININSATVDELKQHPYVRYNLANAIVQYRFQHGNFSSLNDLKKIALITDDIYERVVPYLSIN